MRNGLELIGPRSEISRAIEAGGSLETSILTVIMYSLQVTLKSARELGRC
jgi:hypothetical protein